MYLGFKVLNLGDKKIIKKLGRSWQEKNESNFQEKQTPKMCVKAT